MDKRRMAKVIHQLEKEREALGKSRDRLRAIMGEYEELAETADRAYDDISHVIQSLSEYV